MKGCFLLICACAAIPFSKLQAQVLSAPTIIEVKEDDRVATVYWNSKTNTYDFRYDPDKQNGIYSYLVEWGPIGQNFPNEIVTPYRVAQLQPLEPGTAYEVRISNLSKEGRQSEFSDVVTLEHDPTRVDDMRERLTGFFDDMNQPAGPFDELKWNQSYSGCMKLQHVSQHINSQYHGHNVIASGSCDRAFASSRARELFDFRDRTGVIEFDLDGAHRSRNSWYLDITPGDRKRDVTGQINTTGSQSDPAHLLRIIESGDRLSVQLADAEGILREIPDPYENDACGDNMFYCPGVDLAPVINVRRHWRVELAKEHIRIFIDGILLVDGSLISPENPEGLPYEIAQINWISFSYNTSKENLIMSMVHWDNFGFDAPPGYSKSTVIHNYSDGNLGTETPKIGNDGSIGMNPTRDVPGVAAIEIPDPILDLSNAPPLKAELMFTLQGGHHSWSDADTIFLNGHSYPFAEPSSSITNFQSTLVGTLTPFSALIELDPSHLLVGTNEVVFHLDNPKVLNIHIELTFPIDQAPTYSPPHIVYGDHIQKLMSFRPIADAVGPGIVFDEIDGYPFWTDEFLREEDPSPGIKHWYRKQTPVSEIIPISVTANSWAQLAAKGIANGITHYELWVDGECYDSLRTDVDHAVATFADTFELDTRLLSNGTHEIFVQAFDIAGNPSLFSASSAHAQPGEYLPTLINVQNITTGYDLEALEESISIFPNPSQGVFQIVGSLSQYEITVLDGTGQIYEDHSTDTESMQINLATLPSGIYFVRIANRNNELLSIEKILKY